MSDTTQLCCRVCLELEGDQVSALGSETLRQQLEVCLAISVSDADELPTAVCTACVARLRDFHTFRVTARRAQDWLEASLRSDRKKSLVQPISDSDYNSDSLLEFLNNTENIEEYLDGLGDPDAALPSIVGLLDRQSDSELGKLVGAGVKVTRITSTKVEEARRGTDDTYEIHMEIDVLDSDAEDVPSHKNAQPSVPAPGAGGERVYSCLACKATFSHLGALSSHMSVCERATRTCFECGQRFDSKMKMLKHRISHGESSSKSTCGECGKMFANQTRLIQHYEKCHNDFVARMGCVYRCRECGELFRDRFLLYRHAREHVVRSEVRASGKPSESTAETRTDSRALYRCKVCRTVCASRRQLYVHVERHEAAPRQHLCHACGRSYTSLAAMERHVATHELESAVCEYCGITSERELLQRHLKELHSGI